MILKYLTKNFYISLFIVISIFVLDRVSKIYVIYLNKEGYSSELLTSKFLNITLIWNEGIAFGLFSFNQNYFYNILTVIISFVILIILIMIKNNEGFKKYVIIC